MPIALKQKLKAFVDFDRIGTFNDCFDLSHNITFFGVSLYQLAVC